MEGTEYQTGNYHRVITTRVPGANHLKPYLVYHLGRIWA